MYIVGVLGVTLLANLLLAVASTLAAIGLAFLAAIVVCGLVIAAFFFGGGRYDSLVTLDALSSPPAASPFSARIQSKALALGAILVAAVLIETLSQFYPMLIVVCAVVGWALVMGLLSWILIPILASRA